MYEKEEEYFELDNRIRNLKRELNNLSIEIKSKQKQIVYNVENIKLIDNYFENKLKCIFEIEKNIKNNTLSIAKITYFESCLSDVQKEENKLQSDNSLEYFCNTNNILNKRISEILKELENYSDSKTKNNNQNEKSLNEVTNYDSCDIENQIEDIEKRIGCKVSDTVKKCTAKFRNMNVSYGNASYFYFNDIYRYIAIKFVYSGNTQLGYVMFDTEKDNLFYIGLKFLIQNNEIKNNMNTNSPYNGGRRFKDGITTMSDIEKIQLKNINDYILIKDILESTIINYDEASEKIKNTLFVI